MGSFLKKSGHFFGENTGKFQGFVILSSLCDLDQSVIDLFAKQLNNALNLHFGSITCTKFDEFSENSRMGGGSFPMQKFS